MIIFFRIIPVWQSTEKNYFRRIAFGGRPHFKFLEFKSNKAYFKLSESNKKGGQK